MRRIVYWQNVDVLVTASAGSMVAPTGGLL